MDLKIKGDEGIRRDAFTGAVTATEEEYLKYKQRKASLLREQQRENEFQSLKNEVLMLRDLVYQLVNKV